MATIVTRSGKGSPLTNNEVDANFTNLNTELGTKADTSSLATVATTGAYADLTGKPTIGSADGSIAVTGTTNIDLSVAVAGSTSNVVLPIRNTTGATLTKGTAVYISGATGQLSTVSKAIATSDATSAQTLGLVTADISNNSNGNVTLIGTITNIDTSAYSDGQQLYLSPTTAGALTATKPYAPNHMVYVAVVEHAHPTQGKLFVKVQNGYEMDELHDVSAQSPSNNDGLFYNTSTSLWEKKSIPTALGYTPANKAGDTFTGSINMGGNNLTNAFYLWATGDARAPIFYDSANTAKFIDPSGTSKVGTDNSYIQIGDAGGGKAGVIGNTQGDGTDLFYGTYWAYDSYYDGSNWAALRTTLGRKWMVDMGYHTNLFRVRAYNGAVSSPWADSAWNNIFTINPTGIVTASGDFRAPLFYDSANTAYYVDAAQTGTAINVAGKIYGVNEFYTSTAQNSWGFRATTGASSNASGLWFTGETAMLLLRDSSGNVITRLSADSSTANNQIGGNPIFHDGYHPNADKWTTARTLSLSGDATGSVSWDGSANVTLSTTVVNDSHNHIAPNITGGVFGSSGKIGLSYHPEAGGLLIPAFDNDLSFITQKGGAVSFYYTTDTTYTAQSLTNTGAVGFSSTIPFNGKPDYSGTGITSTSAVVVCDIEMPFDLSYGNTFYVDFGATSWRAKNVTFFAYQTVNNAETTYKMVGSATVDGTDGLVFTTGGYSHNRTSGGLGYAYNRLRVVMTNWNTTVPRIAAIGAVFYNSSKLANTLLSLGGGTVYGTVSSTADFRAPTFYDSNDTGFYFDGAGTSNLNAANFSGNVGIGVAPRARLDVVGSTTTPSWTKNTATTAIFENNGSGIGRSFVTIAGRSNGQTELWFADEAAENSGRVRYDHSIDALSLWTGQSERVSISSSGNVTANTDVRAPIFYDSNDTAYYTNPNSTSNLNGLTVGGSEAITAANLDDANRTYSGHFFLQPYYGAGYYMHVYPNGGAGATSTELNIRTWNGSSFTTAQFITSGYSLAAGSYRAPLFYDSNNTGYYVDAASTSNLNAANFSGNVGIGTSSPAQKLDVTGSANSVQARFGNVAGRGLTIGTTAISGTDDAGVVFNAPTVSGHATFIFQTNSAERMRIDPSGNVGIGTSSPLNKLQINGANIGIRVSDTSGTTNFHEIQSGGTNGQNLFIDADRSNVGSGNMIFRVAGATERMRIDSSGNVGIGKSSPSSRFDVADVTSAGITLTRTDSASGNGFIRSVGNTGATNASINLGGGVNNNMVFAISNSEKMRIDSSGNVGIGTATPTATLTVGGVAGGDRTIQLGSAGATRGVLSTDGVNGVFSIGATNDSTTGILAFKTGSALTEKMRIDSSGNVTLGIGGGAKTILYNDQSIASVNTAGSAYTDLKVDGLNLLFRTGSGSTSEAMRISSSGSVTANVDVRAPIFYDSNNTGYYIDPASTSVLGGIVVNGTLDVRDSNAQFWRSTNGAYQRVDTRTEATSFSRAHWYGVNSSGGTSNFRHAWYDNAAYFNVTAQDGEIIFERTAGDAIVRSTGSFRAPIFYDSNNTAYYVDPASGSYLSSATFDNLITGRNSPSTDVNTANDVGSISIRGSTTTVAAMSFHRAGAYAINMGLGVDNVFRIGGWSASSNAFQMDGVGNTTALTSSRAPIFYDSNNTAYYVDPNSSGTSAVFAGDIHINDTTWEADKALRFREGATDTYGAFIKYTAGDSLELGTRNNSTTDTRAIYISRGANWAGSDGDFRAPIFYDSVSTAYYVDPNSTSNLVGLTVANTITGSITGTAANVTGTVAVANGGTGATTAATARTNIGAAASGANTDITALDQDVTITATGTIAANTLGFRGLPQNSKTASYTLALSDAGNHISITTGGVVIPANGSVAFPIGATIVVFNDSGSSQTISITTDTLRLAGTATTGSRTLAQYGLATLVKVTSTSWVATGNVT